MMMMIHRNNNNNSVSSISSSSSEKAGDDDDHDDHDDDAEEKNKLSFVCVCLCDSFPSLQAKAARNQIIIIIEIIKTSKQDIIIIIIGLRFLLAYIAPKCKTANSFGDGNFILIMQASSLRKTQH